MWDNFVQTRTNLEERVQVPFWGPRCSPSSCATSSPMHLLLPGAGVLLFQEVATSGPECEWPILAAFHRKPDLTDRAGRKQVGVEPGSRQGWHRASEGGAEWGRGLGSSITVKSPNTGPTPKAGCSRGQGFVMPSCALLPVRIRPSSQRQSFPKAPLSLPM